MTNTYNFGGEMLTLTCQPTEHTIGLIQNELNTYNSLFKVNFKPGDIILDLGANLGIISLLLSKKFPFTKIYSFEASPINYKNFVKNIGLIDVEGAEYEIFKNYPKEEYSKIHNIGIEFHKCEAANSFNLKQTLKDHNIPIICEFNAGGNKLI